MTKSRLAFIAVAVLAAWSSAGVAGAAATNAAPVAAAISTDVSKQLRDPGPPKTPCNQRNDGQTTVSSDGSIWECQFEGGYFHWVPID
jgi:hypothetical protein